MWPASLRFALGALALAAACSSPKSVSQRDVRDAASPDAAPSDDDEVTLPGGYVASSCGTLGEACTLAEGCAEGEACAGGLCLPEERAAPCAEGCSGETPVCLLSRCVSVEQLACLCGRAQGRAQLALCAALRDGQSAENLPENALCAGAEDACAAGLSCLTGEDASGNATPGSCKRVCSQDDQCPSDCCTVTDGVAGRHCEPREVCLNACGALDDPCDGQRNLCCDGLVCAGEAPDAGMTDPALLGCKTPCRTHAACETGCCVLFVGSDDGICAPADRCER